MTANPTEPAPPPNAVAAAARAAIEALTVALAMLSPWALGAVEPGAEFCLLCGVAALLVLWAVRMVAEGAVTWSPCPVTLGLGGLLLFSLLQFLPLPAGTLGWLSPGAADLSAQLLPAQREELPFGEPASVPYPAGSSLSLYPGATRAGCVRLLAVFLLFAIVRNNAGSPAALRRLAVAALVNGSLLSLFAFCQSFSSPPGTIYWSLPVPGMPYGPFVCKNHFPFYLNLCIGLGAGLLFARHRPGRNVPDVGGLLHDPAALWVCVALALMVSGVVFSFSRGGVVSLLAGFAASLLLAARGPSRLSNWESGLLITALACALAVWFGLDAIRARLSTLWTGDALNDVRLPLWRDALATGARFPLFGSGLGTFLYTDLAFRQRRESTDVGTDHAHNEYVEAWAEGGIIRLALGLFVIVLLLRAGRRACFEAQGHEGRGLVQGALFALLTVLVHNVFDFGLHIPAIAFLATVVAAHLAAAPKADPVRLGGLAPFAALVAALAVAGVLVLEGWRWARAYALESAASEIVAGREDLDEQYLGLLEEASRTLPERAELHLKAGQAYLEVYERRLASLKHREAVGMAAAAAFAAAAGPGEPLGRVGFACLAPADGTPDAAGRRAVLARRFLVPGLRHHLQARDLCPLIAKAHLRIAASAEWLKRADPREAYLQRAKRAYPVSPEVWYLAGNLELSDRHEQAAWASWRRSLALSPQFLDPIVKRAAAVLGPDRLIEHVLPDDPGTLMAAADRLYPRADDEGREPFLRRALICLQRREEEPTAPELYLKAQLQVALGEEQGALTSYADALLRDPGQVGWRFAYAELLRKRGRLKEARQELRYVLAKEPAHAGATALMQRVAQELAEGD